MSNTRKVILEMDSDDFDALQSEFAQRQTSISKGFLLPDGESDLRGALVGEIVRDLWEYRSLWEADNPSRK